MNKYHQHAYHQRYQRRGYPRYTKNPQIGLLQKYDIAKKAVANIKRKYNYHNGEEHNQHKMSSASLTPFWRRDDIYSPSRSPSLAISCSNKRRNKQTPPLSSSNTLFDCKECNESFGDMHELLNHHDNVHPEMFQSTHRESTLYIKEINRPDGDINNNYNLASSASEHQPHQQSSVKTENNYNDKTKIEYVSRAPRAPSQQPASETPNYSPPPSMYSPPLPQPPPFRPHSPCPDSMLTFIPPSPTPYFSAANRSQAQPSQPPTVQPPIPTLSTSPSPPISDASGDSFQSRLQPVLDHYNEQMTDLLLKNKEYKSEITTLKEKINSLQNKLRVRSKNEYDILLDKYKFQTKVCSQLKSVNKKLNIATFQLNRARKKAQKDSQEKDDEIKQLNLEIKTLNQQLTSSRPRKSSRITGLNYSSSSKLRDRKLFEGYNGISNQRPRKKQKVR